MDGDVGLVCSLDTAAYADGDVLFDTQELVNVARLKGGRACLANLVVFDEDDQGGAFDLIFLSGNKSLGTENSAPNISDANARSIIGRLSVTAADYYDLGGMRIANPKFSPLLMGAVTGATSLWVAGISRDAKTYSASGLRLLFGFARE